MPIYNYKIHSRKDYHIFKQKLQVADEFLSTINCMSPDDTDVFALQHREGMAVAILTWELKTNLITI